MQKSNLQLWAEAIADRNSFKDFELIYTGIYYTPDSERNVIYSGTYNDKPAVLKVYDDPRLLDEPLSLKLFNENNKSEILAAPQLYAYDVVSSNKGWLIMEKLPEEGKFFKSPLSPEERKEFLEFFMEYRRNFPESPTRELYLAENLPSHEYHVFRINRWMSLATYKEKELIMKGEERVLNPEEFIPLYQKGLEVIRKEFCQRKMIWSHGHFKPKEIYKVSSDKFFLTDFAHTKMYPEGYEFGFMIWADHFMAVDWKIDYKEWRKGVFSWIEDLRHIAEEIKIEDYDNLIKASLIERILGTILADICATERLREEKLKRIDLLYRLFNELIK